MSAHTNTNSAANANVEGQQVAADAHNAGQNFSETIKDGWNVVHGAGEELRGSVNSFFDGMGSETTKGARDHPSSSVADQDVYNKGKAEFDSGMSNLQSHHHHHGAAVGAAPSAGSQAATGTVTSTPATAGAVPPKAATSTTGAPTPPHAAATQ